MHQYGLVYLNSWTSKPKASLAEILPVKKVKAAAKGDLTLAGISIGKTSGFTLHDRRETEKPDGEQARDGKKKSNQNFHLEITPN